MHFPDPENPDPNKLPVPRPERWTTELQNYVKPKKKEEKKDIQFNWLVQPENWPPFILFPTKEHRDIIREFEELGQLDQEQKDELNKQFQQMSIDMQKRALEIDLWIIEENRKARKSLSLSDDTRRDVKRLLNRRDKENEPTQEMPNGYPPSQDPFCDIKWAIFLLPGQDKNNVINRLDIARSSHNLLIFKDGGKLRSDNSKISVPLGNNGTAMAGRAAVTEAAERGWSNLKIAGNEEFIQGAREALKEYPHLSAELTTHYGLLGRKREEIMSIPPEFNQYKDPKDNPKITHDGFSGDDGRMDDPSKTPELKPKQI